MGTACPVREVLPLVRGHCGAQDPTFVCPKYIATSKYGNVMFCFVKCVEIRRIFKFILNGMGLILRFLLLTHSFEFFDFSTNLFSSFFY
jgi:hypothetical protein